MGGKVECVLVPYRCVISPTFRLCGHVGYVTILKVCVDAVGYACEYSTTKTS